MSIAKPRTADLVDTITAGYRALNRRPWIIALPAALSATLWLTPPIPLGSLLGLSDLSALGGQLGLSAADWAALSQATLASDARISLAWLNYVPVFPPVPTQTQLVVSSLDYAGPGPLLLLALLINLVVLLVSGLFLSLLAEAVRDERPRPMIYLRQSLRWAHDLVRAWLAVMGIGLILALPFLAISVLVVATLPAATLVVALAWYIAIFWVFVYTGFTPEAILLSQAGPLRALYLSFNLVRRDLAGALGLLILSLVITSGLAIIWHRLADTPLGLTLAIIASAYVGSGLSAARLAFYRERSLRLVLG
ncbi:MAG: hypothetical protein AB4911_16920 [Oscillochloridaceae bacterium umkhey_bin13]